MICEFAWYSNPGGPPEPPHSSLATPVRLGLEIWLGRFTLKCWQSEGEICLTFITHLVQAADSF